MRTFERTTILTAQPGQGRPAPFSYTYALTFWTLGVYLYLCPDCGWCKVR